MVKSMVKRRTVKTVKTVKGYIIDIQNTNRDIWMGSMWVEFKLRSEAVLRLGFGLGPRGIRVLIEFWSGCTIKIVYYSE